MLPPGSAGGDGGLPSLNSSSSPTSCPTSLSSSVALSAAAAAAAATQQHLQQQAQAHLPPGTFLRPNFYHHNSPPLRNIWNQRSVPRKYSLLHLSQLTTADVYTFAVFYQGTKICIIAYQYVQRYYTNAAIFRCHAKKRDCSHVQSIDSIVRDGKQVFCLIVLQYLL